VASSTPPYVISNRYHVELPCPYEVRTRTLAVPDPAVWDKAVCGCARQSTRHPPCPCSPFSFTCHVFLVAGTNRKGDMASEFRRRRACLSTALILGQFSTTTTLAGVPPTHHHHKERRNRTDRYSRRISRYPTSTPFSIVAPCSGGVSVTVGLSPVVCSWRENVGI
jgi:hypothetical protein